MASLLAVFWQVLYAVAVVCVYTLCQRLNDQRKKKARDKQQRRLQSQQDQQPEVQHRGDSATDITAHVRQKTSSATNPDAEPAQPSLPHGLFAPEPSMLELPSLPSDWEIQPQQIEIARRPNGSLWEIGTGAFGKVQCFLLQSCFNAFLACSLGH